MLCLGAKESADVRSEVAAGLYRKLLKEEVTSRRIDSAASPAKVRTAVQARGGGRRTHPMHAQPAQPSACCSNPFNVAANSTFSSHIQTQPPR